MTCEAVLKNTLPPRSAPICIPAGKTLATCKRSALNRATTSENSTIVGHSWDGEVAEREIAGRALALASSCSQRSRRSTPRHQRQEKVAATSE